MIIEPIKLEFDKRVLEADLYLLDMKIFDVILDMEWLRLNLVTIRRHKKEILFCKRRERVSFFGIKFKSLPHIVFTLQVEKMLKIESC